MSASPGNEAVLLIADSELNADMLYAAGMFVPDPFTFLQVNGRTTIMMSDLEIDRARAQSKVDEVVSLTDYTDRAKKSGKTDPGLMDAVVELLREREVKGVSVPNGFPLGYADKLRDRGFEVASKADPFWDRRPVKTDDEVASISNASRHTEDALRMAFGLLAEAIVKDGLLHGPEGPLTSEYIRKRIHVYLLERDCIAQHTIIAGGIQGCDPHNGGSGPLRAGEPIIFDLFPKSTKTGYYADITRTVAKGPVFRHVPGGSTIRCWKDRNPRSQGSGPGWTGAISTEKWNGCSKAGATRRARRTAACRASSTVRATASAWRSTNRPAYRRYRRSSLPATS